MDEPHLTWLTYAFSISKAAQAEKLGGLVDGVKESCEKQEATC